MKIDGRELIGEGKWLALQTLHYTDDQGISRTWESVERRNSSGAVVMLAYLKPGDRLILVRQFRPPTGNYVIEFPAGLIEPGEDPMRAAERELREETGYAGHAVRISRRGYNSPGLTGEFVVFVTVEVDEQTQGELVTDFDESENIQTLVVPVAQLPELLEKHHADGDLIDSKVIAFALAGA